MDDEVHSVMAFDTGPGNVFLNMIATEATQGRMSYDEDGKASNFLLIVVIDLVVLVDRSLRSN